MNKRQHRHIKEKGEETGMRVSYLEALLPHLIHNFLNSLSLNLLSKILKVLFLLLLRHPNCEIAMKRAGMMFRRSLLELW